MNLLELLNLPDVYPLFVTGAGISLASGVPTFRGNDPDAVWANDILERGTLRYFQQNPVIAWDWFLQKFDTCRTAKPNPAHIALAEIETKLLSRGNKCLTVTQNVDGLHRAAGTQNLVEVHDDTVQLVEAVVGFRGHREPRHAQGIYAFLLLVFIAEQDRLRVIHTALANQLE